MIVADHNTRVFGDSLVPIYKFHIPGLLIGPNIPKAKYNKLMAQIDLLPTIFHFMGVNTVHPMIGHDIMDLPEEFPGRAIMQYGLNYAYQVGNRVIILKPKSDPLQFSYENRKLTPTSLDPEFYKEALAHPLWAWKMYSERKYSTN